DRLLQHARRSLDRARGEIARRSLDRVGQPLGYRTLTPFEALPDLLRGVRLTLHELPEQLEVELAVAGHAPKALCRVEAVHRGQLACRCGSGCGGSALRGGPRGGGA